MKTRWKLTSSFTYDLFLLLNILSGDDFYMPFHEQVYAELTEKFDIQQLQSKSAELCKRFKEKTKGLILPASLCLIFSGREHVSIAQIIELIEHRELLLSNLKQSIYWNPTAWRRFNECCTELKEIFVWLKDKKFYEHWKSTYLPQINKAIADIKQNVLKYDIIGELETFIGHNIADLSISVYFCKFAAPLGIRVIGNKFIVDARADTVDIIRVGIHELLHPPYHDNKQLDEYFKQLEKDKFLQHVFKQQIPKYGMAILEGFIHENLVEACEVYLSEKLGLEKDPLGYFKSHDDGSHVLGVVIYHLLKNATDFDNIASFLIRQFEYGKLKPCKLKEQYDAIYQQKN